jgi:ribosomal protein S18 acetylase RimI-like enzyme
MALTVCVPVVDSELALRQYTEGDNEAVRNLLLPTLSNLYPGGASWLDRRLHEVLTGKPKCHLAYSQDDLVGALIETPKDERRVKISTLFVSPRRRGAYIGRRLLSYMQYQWGSEMPSEVYITAAQHVADGVQRCLTPFGFRRIALQVNRYGPGRNEVVFAWRPGG